MNRRNEWQSLLKTANEELKSKGLAIDINDGDEEGFFKCNILKDGKVVETYAENFYEDELETLVDEALTYVKANFISQTVSLKDRAFNASELLRHTYDSLVDELIGIIKANGGLIDTRACSENPTLYAIVEGGAWNESEQEAIQAIRYNEEDGQIYILTNSELDSYAYDTGNTFEYYYDFEGEDKTHFEEAIKGITYFRELNDGYTDMRATIFNIISGLYAYIK